MSSFFESVMQHEAISSRPIASHLGEETNTCLTTTSFQDLQRFPCSPWRRPRWGRLSSCNPWRSMMEQISTCSPWRTLCQGSWMPKEAVTPWTPCAGPGSWQDLWTRGERSPHWSRFVGRTCDPVGEHTLEQSVPEELHPWEGLMLQPVGRTHAGEVHAELPPMGGTPCWSRGRAWEERAGRDNVWWTDRNLHYLSLCTSWEKQVENSGVKPWKKGGVGGRCF